MSNIFLCDTQDRHDNLLPLSFTRPIADFRVGITTIAEKWNAALAGVTAHHPVEYLRPKFGAAADDEALFIAGNLLPDDALVEAIIALKAGEAIADHDGMFIAARCCASELDAAASDAKVYDAHFDAIRFVFDVFLLNGKFIRRDFARLTAGRNSQTLDDTNTVIGPYLDENGRQNIFIEEGAQVHGATINVTGGPVYIGRDAEVMEGACLRGPIAVCDNAHVNMGAKIYGDTTLGPFCKAGGELNNVVMFGYSNKSHDGFLGNAVIGEWCNIGAGTNASNLKNDYTKIRIWNYATHSFMRTDLQFCGLIMGDHSKIGINCMLNTATVMGVGVNLHGAGFPRTFIPSFSEGSPAAGFTEVPEKKFNDIATRVMARRDKELTDADKIILDAVRAIAATLR